ncbi:MAG: hypothetical protein ACRDG4_16795, partial [Chloroflexota bacterium]
MHFEDRHPRLRNKLSGPRRFLECLANRRRNGRRIERTATGERGRYAAPTPPAATPTASAVSLAVSIA